MLMRSLEILNLYIYYICVYIVALVGYIWEKAGKDWDFW